MNEIIAWIGTTAGTSTIILLGVFLIIKRNKEAEKEKQEKQEKAAERKERLRIKNENITTTIETKITKIKNSNQSSFDKTSNF